MRISIVQMCSSSSPDKNMEEVKLAFEGAVEQSSDLLLFPENFLAMGARFKSLVDVDWNNYTHEISELCHEHKLACVAGTIPIEDPQHSPKRLASSIFFDSSGKQAHTYNKIHLFDVDVDDEKGAYRESNYYSPGEEVVQANHGACCIGMTVCFDLRFPALFQAHKRAGANVIIVPSAFTEYTGRKHWEILLRARAIETQCYIVAPDQVGQHDDGRRTWGHSMIVSPDGDVLLNMETDIGVQTMELDLQKISKIRKAMPLFPRLLG